MIICLINNTRKNLNGATNMVTKEAKNKMIEYNDHKPLVLATEKYKSANQWFWSGLIRYPGLMFTSMFIIILNAVISVLPGILLGLALDILAAGDDYLVAVVGSIAGAALLSWLTASLSAYLWSLSSYRFERDIRQEFFDVVQNHSMAFHDEHDSGVLLSMGMNETNQIRFSYTPSLRHLINSMLRIIVVCIYFFIRIPIGTKIIGVADWRIGIGIVSSFIIYLVLAWIYARRIGPIRKELAKELGNVSSSSQETFRGIEVVRSFDSEEIEEAKFEKQSLRLADKTKQEGFLSAFYWPALIMVLFTAISFGIGLWMLSKNDGSMSIGQITSMLSLLIQLVILNFMVPMRLLGLQAGRMNAKRIWNVMTFADPLVEPTSSPEADWTSDLIFDNITFSYPGKKKNVLENVSFRIPAGSRVALLGGPGSGKSTILKLLLRLYDPDEGAIRLNGVNFNEMHTFDVRKDVTLVEQDIFLFGTSFKENIGFSKPDATIEEIRTAAKRAQIARFIETTPDGYETLIGERGVDLSGGQRQRVAIARALLADPKLLLIDDSTSAVDIKTEVRLRLAMEELIKGRTSIVVTQRLSTLVDSDLIIFLDKGKIIDIGSHNELLRRCEEYQFMISLLPVGSQMIEDALKYNKRNGGNN